MKLNKKIFSFIFLLTSITAFSQQAPKARYKSWWLPSALTDIAVESDHIFMVIYWMTIIVFLLVLAFMIYYLFKYRQSANRPVKYTHGNNKLEIFWTTATFAIMIWIALYSKSVWVDMKYTPPSEDKSLVINVKPRQFQWDITYSGEDGKFDTPDDINTVNQLHVPAGKDVLLKLTAQDVIHSFFIPEFRMKQDALPGMLTRYWFNCPKPVNLEIACAELCGLGHGRMRGYLTVMESSEFDKWYMAEKAKVAKTLTPTSSTTTDTSKISETKNSTNSTIVVPTTEEISKVEVGGKITLNGITFASGSDKISVSSEIVLNNVYDALKEKKEEVVQIQGFSDNSGNKNTNLLLSEKRANAVMIWLVKKGIDKKNLTSKGYGPENPIADNATAEGREKNRRIEFSRVK
ncbi:MAG: cytochrome c oxidase subunit II [Chlorobiota bacterium]|jgi:cytochrome c oxidase subunit 2|nr:MAG: cytochrome c oxidase subunit II [Chlorobiota bacterium]